MAHSFPYPPLFRPRVTHPRACSCSLNPPPPAVVPSQRAAGRASLAGAEVADEVGHLPRGPGRIFKAAVWSMQGLRAAWLHESSFRLEVYLFVLLAPLALWLGDSGVERALMIGSMLLVLGVELLNSAIDRKSTRRVGKEGVGTCRSRGSPYH